MIILTYLYGNIVKVKKLVKYSPKNDYFSLGLSVNMRVEKLLIHDLFDAITGVFLDLQENWIVFCEIMTHFLSVYSYEIQQS